MNNTGTNAAKGNKLSEIPEGKGICANGSCGSFNVFYAVIGNFRVISQFTGTVLFVDKNIV
ncbi:hypothetical protein [Adhaeribacter terreus]|uniref:Uncharacterized protein n=1 Tax=Adhaeribacter terreus TaxID=529703 RepID=A0ABW0EAV9_9BACT